MKNKSNKTYAEQTEGIEKTELDRRKAAGECQWCAWPADRKGSHKTMDCIRWAKNNTGTAQFPKAKEYQKLKIGAYDQEESDVDQYMTDKEDSDIDSEIEQADEEEELLEEEDKEEVLLEEEDEEEELLEEEDEDDNEEVEEAPALERNWWDSDSDFDN